MYKERSFHFWKYYLPTWCCHAIFSWSQCWQEFLWHIQKEHSYQNQRNLRNLGKDRYIDTITYIKPDFITDVIDILNKFHQNIKFTNEVKHNGKISFLDVLLMRFNGKLETFVRKLITTYIWIEDLLLPLHGKRLH